MWRHCDRNLIILLLTIRRDSWRIKKTSEEFLWWFPWRMFCNCRKFTTFISLWFSCKLFFENGISKFWIVAPYLDKIDNKKAYIMIMTKIYCIEWGRVQDKIILRNDLSRCRSSHLPFLTSFDKIFTVLWASRCHRCVFSLPNHTFLVFLVTFSQLIDSNSNDVSYLNYHKPFKIFFSYSNVQTP